MEYSAPSLQGYGGLCGTRQAGPTIGSGIGEDDSACSGVAGLAGSYAQSQRTGGRETAEVMMAEGSVVTFYSYKGGVGRTLALANIGALLSRWGYKVLCIDWDLEAPGLPLYFERWIQSATVSGPSSRPGLTELIHAYVDGQQPNWREFLTEVQFPETNQPLMLMTAGKQDQDYVQRMQSLDWKRLYEEHQLGNFLETLRAEWKEAFDFVLIDSRTGITDIGGICTVQLPDLLVLLFTANMQSLRGSLDIVTRAKQARNSLPFDRSKLLVLPVATRFEVRIEYELAQQWLKTFATELKPLHAEWAHKDVTTEELLNYTRVPYIPFWSFGEKLPVIERGTDDPEDIGFSLETLAALIAQKFSYSDVLVRNRDSFVNAVKRRAEFNGTIEPPRAKSGLGVRVFISYAHRDQPLLDELLIHLTPMVREGLIGTLSDSVSTSWEDNLSAHLEEADVILMLISPDFLASKNFEVQAMRAHQRFESGEARVLAIQVRPTSWQNTPVAGLPSTPRGHKSIVLWQSRDEAWLEVANAIRGAAADILASRRTS